MISCPPLTIPCSILSTKAMFLALVGDPSRSNVRPWRNGEQISARCAGRLEFQWEPSALAAGSKESAVAHANRKCGKYFMGRSVVSR